MGESFMKIQSVFEKLFPLYTAFTLQNICQKAFLKHALGIMETYENENKETNNTDLDIYFNGE